MERLDITISPNETALPAIHFYPQGAWDVSGYIYLIVEIENLSEYDQLASCSIDKVNWDLKGTYIPAGATKKLRALIMRPEYSKKQLEYFPRMNGLPYNTIRLHTFVSPPISIEKNITIHQSIIRQVSKPSRQHLLHTNWIQSIP